VSNLIWYVVLAVAGGFLLQKLRVPGGMMVGAALACGIANISIGLGSIPALIKILAQVLSGIYIGISVDSDELKSIKEIIKPFGIIMAGMLITNLLSGFVVYLLSPLDAITSFLAVTPGGVNNMPLIAADMGADPAMVAVFQCLRMIIGVGVFPGIIKTLAKKHDDQKNKSVKNESAAPTTEKEKTTIKGLLELLVAGLLAAFAGWLGTLIGFPSAYLVFCMLASIAAKVIRTSLRSPASLRMIAQLLSGIYIGNAFTKEVLASSRYLLLPIVLMMVLYALNCFISGWLVNKKNYFGYAESLLASSPAGASDMALLAADMGIQNSHLNFIHVLRLLIVVAFFPFLLQWLITLLSL